MSRVVVLDTSPLGLATSASGTPDAIACARWAFDLVEAGVRVIVPEMADYEVRRELIRAGKIKGLARLDAFHQSFEYLP